MTTPIAYIVLDESSPRLIAGQYQFERACSGALIMPSGSAFPGDPFAGEIFWRTDLSKLYRRDNTNAIWEEAAGSTGNGDPDAEYLVLSNTGSLSAERAITSSVGILFDDGGANSNFTIRVNELEVPILSASNTFTGPNIFQSGISGSHTHLDDGTSYLLAGANITVTTESNGAVTIASTATGGGDNDAEYLVLANTASLSNERQVTNGVGILFDDAGANSTFTIRVNELQVPFLSASNTFTGVNTFNAGLSGSLTQLSTGASYIESGEGINVASSSNGPIVISGVGGNMLLFGDASIFTSTTTRYLYPGAHDGGAHTIELQYRIPRAGSIRNFRVRAENAGAGAATLTYTLRVNGIDSALTFTMSNTAQDGSDLANSVVVVAGDLLSVSAAKSTSISSSPDHIFATMEFV